MGARVLVLINGIHTKELLDSLARLIDVTKADLLLVHVRGPDPRASLEMLRHRPGRRPLSPHRQQEILEAESVGAVEALAEAEDLGRSLGASVETINVTGEPGRMICDLAARRRADLVVVRVGGRDRPPIGPSSLGPIARYITDHSPSPVLLLQGP